MRVCVCVCVGMTIADWAGHWKKTPQTLVLKRVDNDAFQAAYLSYIADFAGVCLSVQFCVCESVCFCLSVIFVDLLCLL